MITVFQVSADGTDQRSLHQATQALRKRWSGLTNWFSDCRKKTKMDPADILSTAKEAV